MRVVRLEVGGVVQGVGFRWFTREAARRRRLAGWVRNREDGNVEIAVAGEGPAVAAFLLDVRRGPSGSRVETVRELPPDSLEPLPNPFAVVR